MAKSANLILIASMIVLFGALSYLLFSSLYGEQSDIDKMVREHDRLVGQVDRERPETDKLLQELLVLEEKAAWLLSEKGELIKKLRDQQENALFSEVYAGDKELDEQQVQELAALPVKKLVQKLLASIEDSDKLTIALLCAALREKKDEAFDYLNAAAADTNDKRNKFGYLYALSQLQDRRALGTFQRVLADKSETDALVQRAAASGLVALPDKSSVPVLISALQNSTDWGVKVNSAAALGLIKDSRAIKPLKDEFTGAANATVRSFTLLALAHIADPRSVEFFSGIARTSSEESHAVIAIQGLSRIESPDALKVLQDIARNCSGPAAEEARRMLDLDKKENTNNKKGPDGK